MLRLMDQRSLGGLPRLVCGVSLLDIMAECNSRFEEGGWETRDMKEVHTSCPSRANRAVARIVGITTNVSHSRIQQTFAIETFPEQVFHAPEATCCDSAFLSRFRDVLGSGCAI